MKKVLSVFLSVVILCTVFFSGTVSAFAAEAGTLPSNAIVLEDGVWRTKYWTKDNWNLFCYNKIEVPSQGYITLTLSKPFDDEGEICSYRLKLLDSNGVVIWGGDTESQEDSFNENYTYRIGLKAGTYILNIDPSFFVYSNSAPIETRYKFDFTADLYWEIENNNDMQKATEMAVGKKYTGIYAEESSDVTRIDFFKAKLTVGKKYRLTIGNYVELDAHCIFKIYDPSDNEISTYRYKEGGEGAYWDITATESGYYYFKIYNDFNEPGVEYTIMIEEGEEEHTHKYDNACDASCNLCGAIRAVNHSYSAATCTAPKTCKVCGATSGSALGHKYSNACDAYCNVCNAKRSVGAHKYSNSCDTSCNTCGAKRSISHKYTKVTTKAATTSKNGYTLTECSVCGKDKSKTTIYAAKTVKLSATEYTYNGKTKKPTVTVKDSKGKTISKSNYTVTYASGRKYVGKYKVTVKFKGNYSGTKTLYFEINPGKTTVKKASGAKKSIKVYVNKKTTQVSGYQIQYSTSKKFTSAKTKTITSAKTTSATIKSLKAKKTYYVRVRTYKTVNGKKYYSGWSSHKSAKTK